MNTEQRMFIEKLSAYLIKNCKAVYGEEYIARLVHQICLHKGIDTGLYKGHMTIKKDNVMYKVPHVVNVYDGEIIDLSLFVFRHVFTDRYLGKVGKSRRIYSVTKFENLPDYLITKNNELLNITPEIDYVKYEVLPCRNLEGVKFETNSLFLNDKLILGIYNDLYALHLSDEVDKIDLSREVIRSKIDTITYPYLTQEEAS
ncbi:MAG: hypothetical protein N4A40_12615 [Tissierellales bacterium]|nr:hypothetical protein [Tissierellales bacterium]